MTKSGLSDFVDAAGTAHLPVVESSGAALRIVSLVPSITELVCDLGLAGNLVGRTGFCVHPREILRGVPKVGGTKTVDVVKVRALAPTHVILNIDENLRETAEKLRGFVPHLIVTHPLAPQDNVALFHLLGGIFNRETEAARLIAEFSAAHEKARSAHAAMAHRKVLYLIWKQPWMTVSRDTYISRTLAHFALDTVPENSDERYPTIALPGAAAESDIVLLSTEPYSFRKKDVAALREQPAFAGKRVELINGEMTSWYGPRAIAGLQYLADFRARLD